MTKAVDRRSWQAECAEAGRELGWKLAGGGTLYRATDEYVFELHAPAPRVGHDQRGSLRAKPLALDPVFWEITGSHELLRKRLAFRVNGAFTVPSFSIADSTYTTGYLPGTVVKRLHGQYGDAQHRFRTASDFQALVEAQSPPRSGQHLATCVTWCIAIGQHDKAAQLLREAIGADLGGGFAFPGGTFEELALDHLGFENERGHHVELIDGRYRRIFPGARWTPEQRLGMDLTRMNGVERFALALWKLPEDADRRVVDGRWDDAAYIQCAGGPDRFVIELRRTQNDEAEQVVVGHGVGDVSTTSDVRRGDHVSSVYANETFTRDEALEILLHYVEHDDVASHLTTRPLGHAAGEGSG